MEDREITALLADFETVWKRVSPPADGESAPPEPAERGTQKRPEPQNGRVPRWFCEI